MKLRRAFTLIELLVVVAVIALLIAILVPSLGKARKQARTSVCMTNERTLVQSYRFYFQENQTVLYSTGHGNTGAWDYQLLGKGFNPTTYYTKNGKGTADDKIRWCPETQSNKRFTGAQVGTANLAWDCRYGPGGGSTGSYAMNNYLYVGSSYRARGAATTSADFYRIGGAILEATIPVFTDALWHDVLPRVTDVPGINLEDPEASNTRADRSLADVAVDRHGRAVNVSFWDGHVEPVKLPDLWVVKWSATWSRASPYRFPN